MHAHRHAVVIALAFALATLTACGGGSTGFSTPSDPLRVTSTSLPAGVSGQEFRHVIPLDGGCGGPYVLSVVAGRLPNGLRLLDETHSIEGVLLEDGPASFGVQVLDTGCNPFQSTQVRFSMAIDVGGVTIVQALLDGEPSLEPPGGAENPLYPALPTVVYNDFVSVDMLVAGGVAPYRIQVIDDPQVPDDGVLPLGVSIPSGSTSLLGSPSEVGPSGRPFVITLEAIDAVGSRGQLTVQWKIDTPSIIVVNESLANGQCGVPYNETFVVAEGVPPFTHEFVEQGLPEDFTSVVEPDVGDVVYSPGGPPTVTPPEALVKIDGSIYAAATDFGPAYDATNEGSPPEGLRLVEESGALTGVARRRGTFRVHYHVQSTLVPDSFGQHSWRSFTFAFQEAPPLVHDPAYTLGSDFPAASPYVRIAPAEKTQIYNPDAVTEPLTGLQLLAQGGVAKDGWTDAPHQSQATSIEGSDPGEELPGSYDWSVDLDPDLDGGNDPITAMELVPHVGIWRATQPNDLVPQLEQEIAFTAFDQSLPEQVRLERLEKVGFEVGPDVVIITESQTSYTGTTSSNLLMNDANMKVRALVPFTAGAVLRDLNSDDLAEGHGVPSTAGTSVTLAQLLTGVDLLRTSINPTGWWDDLHGLNPRAARPLQHGDRNTYVSYYGMNYPGSTSSTSSFSGTQPSATAVRLPRVTSAAVTDDPASGVYASGGKLYVFDSSTRFGVFVVREDSRIYVPVAFDKTTYTNFGDNWNQAHSTTGTHSMVQMPQLTVSPDGRFAAMKLRTSFNRLESANLTRIVLFSLAGEKPASWGGATWKVVETGSSGATSEGVYQFASSLTLTNDRLYYLIGSGSTIYLSWKDHYIYRYDVLGGAAAGALLSPNAHTDWLNSAGSPMQTPFQRYYNDFTESLNRPSRYMLTRSGYNATEVSLAPHPFRVSANGRACAILAGPSTTSTSGSTVMTHHVWVDYDGTLHKLSATSRRAPQGGSRGFALRDGPESFPNLDWGARRGPTTGFEISDDGLKVAVVINRDTSILGSKSYLSTPDWLVRDDVVAFQPVNGTAWSSGSEEIQVTGDEVISTNAIFSSTITWRFGALTFTRAGDGLVFWGGYSNYAPNLTTFDSTYGRYKAKSYVGSLYSYHFGDEEVQGMLAASEGGHEDGAGEVYTVSNKVTVSTARWSTSGGTLKPVGGFISPNGNFFYLVNSGALSTSHTADMALVGVNIRSLDDTQAINGHDDGRAFEVDGMPDRRGFLAKYSGPYSYLGIGSTFYRTTSPSYYGGWAPGGVTGAGLQVGALENGRVFFATHSQRFGSSSVVGNSRDYQYGGPALATTYADYGWYQGHVCLFDADVGGDIHQITGSALGPNSGGSFPAYYRPIVYLEVSPDGRSVAFLYGNQSNIAYPREKIGFVGNIDMDPATGALLPGSFFENLTSGAGRMGSAMTFDVTRTKLITARGTGSNENSKTLHVDLFDPTGVVGSSPLGFPAANYNVLHAGR